MLLRTRGAVYPEPADDALCAPGSEFASSEPLMIRPWRRAPASRARLEWVWDRGKAGLAKRTQSNEEGTDAEA
jgi:hypothetical protein